jgi:hypothetical protein
MDIYIALVHHPVRNRLGETVTTAVTNIDIHDLARAARTYDVRATFIVTPIEQQRSLVGRIIGHWDEGEGASHNPIRARAFERLRVARDVDDAVAAIEAELGSPPTLVATGAKLHTDITEYAVLRDRIAEAPGALLLVFGTGFGLTDEILDRCSLRLPAIKPLPGRGDYNHLSVRSAVSIILDRLLGDR